MTSWRPSWTGRRPSCRPWRTSTPTAPLSIRTQSPRTTPCSGSHALRPGCSTTPRRRHEHRRQAGTRRSRPARPPRGPHWLPWFCRSGTRSLLRTLLLVRQARSRSWPPLSPAITPSSSNPIYLFRSDAAAGRSLEYTTDGIDVLDGPRGRHRLDDDRRPERMDAHADDVNPTPRVDLQARRQGRTSRAARWRTRRRSASGRGFGQLHGAALTVPVGFRPLIPLLCRRDQRTLPTLPGSCDVHLQHRWQRTLQTTTAWPSTPQATACSAALRRNGTTERGGQRPTPRALPSSRSTATRRAPPPRCGASWATVRAGVQRRYGWTPAITSNADAYRALSIQAAIFRARYQTASRPTGRTPPVSLCTTGACGTGWRTGAAWPGCCCGARHVEPRMGLDRRCHGPRRVQRRPGTRSGPQSRPRTAGRTPRAAR